MIFANSKYVIVYSWRVLTSGASADAPGTTVEAYAHAPSLSGASDGELLSRLADQGVVGVTRLRKTKTGQDNPGIRLRFRGGSFPPTITARTTQETTQPGTAGARP